MYKFIQAMLVLITLLYTNPSYAWDVRIGNVTHKQATDVAVVMKREERSLPPCVRETIEGGLKHVLVLKTDPNHPFIDATSYPTVGIMIVYIGKPWLDKSPLPVAIMHEFGHWYDFQKDESRSKQFQNALALDWAKITDPQMKKETAFLSTPREAFAELFAATFLGINYYKYDHYHVELFPHAHQALVDYICQQSQPVPTDEYIKGELEDGFVRKHS